MFYPRLKSKDLTFCFILWRKSDLLGFWYNILLPKCYGTPSFLGDSGLKCMNAGI